MTERRKRTKSERGKHGSSLAESAISTFLTVVIVAISADVTIFALAFMNLDKTTRDCARAASNAVPSSTQTYAQAALAAAQTELKNHSTDGFFCQQPQLYNNQLVTYQDWTANAYPTPYNSSLPPNIPNATPISGITPSTTPQTPYLTVSCTEAVRLPIPISFFGVSLVNNTNNGMLTLARMYTFPIIKYNFNPANAQNM
jgi:hypothetical protein